jgi:hypothetical protein
MTWAWPWETLEQLYLPGARGGSSADASQPFGGFNWLRRACAIICLSRSAFYCARTAILDRAFRRCETAANLLPSLRSSESQGALAFALSNWQCRRCATRTSSRTARRPLPFRARNNSSPHRFPDSDTNPEMNSIASLRRVRLLLADSHLHASM